VSVIKRTTAEQHRISFSGSNGRMPRVSDRLFSKKQTCFRTILQGYRRLLLPTLIFALGENVSL
jgi:hypothetical protein